MDREEALAALEQVKTAMHGLFDASVHAGRLGQLDSALATVAMAVEHLYDEEVREQDLVDRVKTSRAARDSHEHQLRVPLEAM